MSSLTLPWRMRRLARKRRGGSAEDSSPLNLSYKIHIATENNFPTAAGLASSAAGYACLGWLLGRISLQKGLDSLAHQVAPETHWPELRVLVLVVSGEKKQVGSTAGMQTSVDTSPLLKVRGDGPNPAPGWVWGPVSPNGGSAGVCVWGFCPCGARGAGGCDCLASAGCTGPCPYPRGVCGTPSLSPGVHRTLSPSQGGVWDPFPLPISGGCVGPLPCPQGCTGPCPHPRGVCGTPSLSPFPGGVWDPFPVPRGAQDPVPLVPRGAQDPVLIPGGCVGPLPCPQGCTGPCPHPRGVCGTPSLSPFPGGVWDPFPVPRGAQDPVPISRGLCGTLSPSPGVCRTPSLDTYPLA
uniref:Mevalonate diphosphate decarboxylase n=1 Tax=Bubo bubo TaxID=30461 RepID=A0A8C0ERZ4_BUBBB